MELFETELFSDKRINELEEKVDSIIAGYLVAKEENGKLLDRIQLLEQENADLKGKISESHGERQRVTEKVKRILEKIEKVEV